MQSSNLAMRLGEFEAWIDSLNLVNEPETRRLAAVEAPAPRSRRRPRPLTLKIRDQGLRPFRVC
jgi:hypothetical protein